VRECGDVKKKGMEAVAKRKTPKWGCLQKEEVEGTSGAVLAALECGKGQRTPFRVYQRPKKNAASKQSQGGWWEVESEQTGAPGSWKREVAEGERQPIGNWE